MPVCDCKCLHDMCYQELYVFILSGSQDKNNSVCQSSLSIDTAQFVFFFYTINSNPRAGGV